MLSAIAQGGPSRIAGIGSDPQGSGALASGAEGSKPASEARRSSMWRIVGALADAGCPVPLLGVPARRRQPADSPRSGPVPEPRARHEGVDGDRPVAARVDGRPVPGL